MATSGSIDFSANRNDIITEALEQLGELGEGITPNQDQIDSCNRTLNWMLKHWQTKGLNLFAMQRVYLYLKKEQKEYNLGVTTSDHFAAVEQSTLLNGAVSSGGTSLTVDDASGMDTGDYIGVEVASNVVSWDTIQSTDQVTSVTLTTGLSAAAADDAKVYYYTNKANRPMKIIQASRRDKNGIDLDIDIWAREDYIELSNKDTDGLVTNLYYDPQVGSGNLFTWPRTDNETNYLVLYVQRTLEDLDDEADDVDFPQEWYLPIMWNLAMNLLPKYGADQTRRAEIRANAQETLYDAWAGDTEAYIKIAPETRYNR